MIWGDQWLCPCGTSNLFLRTKCRNCSEQKLPDETIEPWTEGVGRVEEENRRKDGAQ